MKRTFIAIDIPLNQNIIDFITTAQSFLQDEKIKWIHEEQIHLTIKFLGDTGISKINDIKSALFTLSKNHSPIELTIKNAGIFKNLRAPRIIWLGIKENEALNKLNKDINIQLVNLGFSIDDKPFNPHLTIGRIKFIKHINKLTDLLEHYKDIDLNNSIINEFIYYESILKPDGHEYRILQKFILEKN